MNILQKTILFFFNEYTFPDCRDKNPLPFDFFLPEYNLCIEYDGEQHFKPVRFSKTMSDEDMTKKLEITQIHDDIKNKYCHEHGLILIRISYTDDLDLKLCQILEKVA